MQQVDELVSELQEQMEKVVYLHTRRQHIMLWLADSPLFPLLSWNHNKRDEYGQPRLVLHTKREKVHDALVILLKSKMTEWLYKRIRHATTSEGEWLFKQGAYERFMANARKAIGEE